MLQGDCDKWIKISAKHREEDVTSQVQLKDIAKLKKNVLPEPQFRDLKSAIE